MNDSFIVSQMWLVGSFIVKDWISILMVLISMAYIIAYIKDDKKAVEK